MGVSSLALAWLLLAQSGDITPINSRSFGIPITINDPAQRAKIRSLLLYVSSDEGKNWSPTANATPDQPQFRFNATADGVYWFTVLTVDPSGVRNPVDPYHADVSQKILVDTVPPVIKTFTADRNGEDVVVLWDVQEDHPDLNSLRMEYRAQDAPTGTVGTPIPVALPVLKGEVHFHPNVPGSLVVRMEIRDTAGNPSAPHDAIVPAAPAPLPPTTVAMIPPASAGNTVAAAALGTLPGSTAAAATQPAPFNPPGHDPLPAAPVAPPAPPGPRVIASSGGASEIVPVSASLPAPAMPTSMPLPHPQLVNDRQISLDYEVRTGPSGLSKVELWVTKDDGRSWEFLTDNPSLHPPITASLPGEGVFGLRMVVCSGAGLSKGPPQPGDLPEVRIEVDLTPPKVDLLAPRPDPYQQRDALVLSWNATDRNLPSRPVKLEYAEKPEGNWLPVAAELPAAGSYTWQMPKNVPYRVYLRATAVDLAGNRTMAETRDPVVIDMTSPEVVSIHPISLIKKVSAEVPVPESAPRPPQPMPERLPVDSTPRMAPPPPPPPAAAAPPMAPRPAAFESAPVERASHLPTVTNLPTPPATATESVPTGTSESGTPLAPPPGNP